MSALYARCTQFDSKLTHYKDICLTIDGIPTIIEYSYHSIKQSKHRAVFEAAATMMVQNAFDELLDLRNDERFIIISLELGISVIGNMRAVGGDIVIGIVTVIDSTEPYNPHNTHTITI